MTERLSGFLGIDIGGTRTKYCIASADGHIVTKHVIDTLANQGQAAVLERIQDSTKRLLHQGSVSISSIGIGVCGPTNFDLGTLITSPILVGWENVPLQALFQNSCQLPTFVDNDANLAIWAETVYGVAQGATNVVGFTVGTGVGGAIVINNLIYRGSHWYGGELGHMTVTPNGRVCPCGNRGCLTMEASAEAITEQYVLLKGTVLSSKQIFDLASQRDATAFQAIRPMVTALSIGAANVLNIFDPDCLVIAGGPTHAGQWLLDLIIDQVQQRVYRGLLSQTKVAFAQLGEWAGAYGAAALAAAMS